MEIKEIDLELTNECNTKCAICPRESMTRPKGYISGRTFEMFLEWCRKSSIDTVTLGGFGEPLLHPDIANYVKNLKENNFTVRLITNGEFLGSEKSDALINAGIDEIWVSQQAFTKHTAKKCNTLDFDKVMHNFKHAFEKSKGTRTKVKAYIIKSSLNLKDSFKLESFFRSKGVDTIVAYCQNKGGRIENSMLHPVSRKNMHERKSFCNFPFKKILFLTWDGNFLGCSNDFKGEHILGTLGSTDYEKIMAIKKQLADSSEIFSICRKCSGCDSLAPNYEKKVSIGMGVISAEFLDDAIKSVLNQTSHEWELRIIVDGPLPEERSKIDKILDKYSGIRKIIVERQENKGIGIVRKRLFESTNCMFLLPLDADDMLAPKAVELFLKAFEENPDSPMIRAFCAEIDKNGRKKGLYEPPKGSVTETKSIMQPWCFSHYFYDSMEPLETFPEYNHVGDEIDLLLKMEEFGGIKVIKKPLYIKRDHKGNFLNERPDHAKALIKKYIDKAIKRRENL